jgi:hypothetical protein
MKIFVVVKRVVDTEMRGFEVADLFTAEPELVAEL